jgi:uroporphyrinogen decarboxylase
MRSEGSKPSDKGESDMNSRERVRAALRMQKTERVPVDFGGTIVTCLDVKAHENLLKHYGIRREAGPVIDYTMGTVEPDEALMIRFGSDVRRVGMNVSRPDIVNGMYTDGFGMMLKKADPHEYFDVIHHPLEDATVDDIAHMKLPDPDNEALYKGLREKAKRLYETTDYALVADFGVPGFYETSQKLRGYMNLACDLMTDIDFVLTLYDRLLVLQKRWFKNYLECVGDYVEAIGYADDLGMQDRPQISPQSYKDVIKPYHRQIFAYIHSLADVKVLLHSCGAIVPLIDDLIEAGVDVLNPVQTRAAGMDTEALFARFGGRVAFWGGFDEQQILPFGSKDEIEAEAARLMRTLPRGYVFGPGHNIQADTPAGNVEAMFDAAEKFR